MLGLSDWPRDVICMGRFFLLDELLLFRVGVWG